MKQIKIRGEFITLGQLLKLEGIIGSGGDVREFLAESDVLVNGERELRRGRKLRLGDRVQLPAREELQMA